MKFILFLIFSAGYYAHAKCNGNEFWFKRIKFDSYKEMKATHTAEWLKENKIKLTSKKQLLENFLWENAKGSGPKLPSKAYSYKFSMDQNCDIQVSKLNFLEAEKLTPDDMNHVLLAEGEKTITAGIINLYYIGDEPHMSITPGSTRFCPKFESLSHIKKRLLKHGWKGTQIDLVNVPGADCPKD